MKDAIKIIISLSIIPLLIGIFFFSNIKGYYRFKQYCEAEGGLRVYEKLERNVGWLAKDKYEAMQVSSLSGVGFVRYTDDKDKRIYDVKYIEGNPQYDNSYEFKVSDDKPSTKYVWKSIDEPISDEIRLSRFGHEILSISDNKILIRYFMFSYQTTDPKSTPFGPAQKMTCFLNSHDSTSDGQSWKKHFEKIFIN